MTLFGLLGYPAVKAEFKTYNVTLDDFLYVVNTKKRAGQLGRDDTEGELDSELSSMNHYVSQDIFHPRHDCHLITLTKPFWSL